MFLSDRLLHYCIYFLKKKIRAFERSRTKGIIEHSHEKRVTRVTYTQLTSLTMAIWAEEPGKREAPQSKKLKPQNKRQRSTVQPQFEGKDLEALAEQPMQICIQRLKNPMSTETAKAPTGWSLQVPASHLFHFFTPSDLCLLGVTHVQSPSSLLSSPTYMPASSGI